MFLNTGRLAIGDTVTITDQRLEPIPYVTGERIRWLLKRHGPAAAAMNLVHEVGLPAASSKVTLKFLRKLAFASGG